MSDRISRRWVEYITDFVNAGPLLDQSDGNSSGKEGSKLAPRQKPPSSPGDVAPSLYSDGPSGIKQAEDAFIYREEMHQLALELADANAGMENACDHQDMSGTTEKGDRSNRGTDHGHTGPTEGNPGAEQRTGQLPEAGVGSREKAKSMGGGGPGDH